VPERDVDEKTKLQEVLLYTAREGGHDSVLTIRTINSYIQQLKGEVDHTGKLERSRPNSKRSGLISWSI
jgi:hypothetical protein